MRRESGREITARHLLHQIVGQACAKRPGGGARILNDLRIGVASRVVDAASGAASGAGESAVPSLPPARCSFGASPSSAVAAGAFASAGAVAASRVVTVRGLLRSPATGARTVGFLHRLFRGRPLGRRRGTHQYHPHGGLRIVGTHLHRDLIARMHTESRELLRPPCSRIWSSPADGSEVPPACRFAAGDPSRQPCADCHPPKRPSCGLPRRPFPLWAFCPAGEYWASGCRREDGCRDKCSDTARVDTGPPGIGRRSDTDSADTVPLDTVSPVGYCAEAKTPHKSITGTAATAGRMGRRIIRMPPKAFYTQFARRGSGSGGICSDDVVRARNLFLAAGVYTPGIHKLFMG